MPPSNTPERTKLERKSSLIHDAMERAHSNLSDAVSAFHALEEHFDLSEQTIESVDGWVHRIEKSLSDTDYLIRELGDWAFDGDSYCLMENADDEEAE